MLEALLSGCFALKHIFLLFNMYLVKEIISRRVFFFFFSDKCMFISLTSRVRHLFIYYDIDFTLCVCGFFFGREL